MARVQAILVNYNGDADTIECLHSLKAQTGADCAPLVINNGSRLGSVRRIQDAHPDVEIMETGRNLGFAGGNNVGMARALKANFDFVFLVNNDTALEPECLVRLLRCAQSRPDAAVVSPAMYYYHDREKPWFTGGGWNQDTGAVSHAVADVRGQTEPYETPWTTGCAMLITAARLRDVGLFDARFFCYFEDLDWCLRARQKGGACVISPDAVLYHKVWGTSGRDGSQLQHYYSARNYLLFVLKNVGGTHGQQLMRRRTRLVWDNSRRLLRDPQEAHDRKMAIASLLGLLDFGRRRFGRCPYSWL